MRLFDECAKAGNPDIVYKFTSTSKVSFPGSGIAAVAASKANLDDFRKYMTVQTIGHDKLNQLRHVRFFKDINGLHEHMKKHADILRPKFELVLQHWIKNLTDLESVSGQNLTVDISFPLIQWKAVRKPSLPKQKKQALS